METKYLTFRLREVDSLLDLSGQKELVETVVCRH